MCIRDSRTAAAFTADGPQYARLAARLLSAYVDKEVAGQGVHSFSQSIALGAELSLINDRVRQTVETHARKFNDAIDMVQTRRFEYFGLRTLYDRYPVSYTHLDVYKRQASSRFAQFDEGRLRAAFVLSGNPRGHDIWC